MSTAMLNAPQKRRRKRNPTDTVFIYGLACPHENIVRYVGQTAHPYGRLISHALSNKHRKLRRWIASLVSDARLPRLMILEVTTSVHANTRERVWISHFYGRHGDRLLNRAWLPRSHRPTSRPRTTGRPTGRPKKLDAFDDNMRLRCTDTQKSLWEQKAKADGSDFAKWVRSVLDAAAK